VIELNSLEDMQGWWEVATETPKRGRGGGEGKTQRGLGQRDIDRFQSSRLN